MTLREPMAMSILFPRPILSHRVTTERFRAGTPGSQTQFEARLNLVAARCGYGTHSWPKFALGPFGHAYPFHPK